MINRWSIMLGVVCMLLVSCVRIPLSKTEQSFNPYTGNEVLVFKSDKVIIHDTVYVFAKYISYMDGPAPISPNSQSLSIRAFIPMFKMSYGIEKNILAIVAKSHVSFSLSINSYCYFFSKKTIDEINSLPIDSLKIGGNIYNDVIIIEPTREASKDSDASLNPVVKVYWSKRHGYLRFEKKDGEHYDLVNKYMDEAKCASFR